VAVSEERLQILLPRSLKKFLREAASRRGVSIGAYIRQLIEADQNRAGSGDDTTPFPFGVNPIRTGRTRGSVDHDRPGS
jgi:hypothetical protein